MSVEPRILGAFDLTAAAWPDTYAKALTTPAYAVPDMLPQAVYFVEVFTTCRRAGGGSSGATRFLPSHQCRAAPRPGLPLLPLTSM